MCFSQEYEENECNSSAKKLLFDFNRTVDEIKRRKDGDIDIGSQQMNNYLQASGIDISSYQEDLTPTEYHKAILRSSSDALKFLIEAETVVLQHKKAFFFTTMVEEIAKKYKVFPECLFEEYKQFYRIKRKFSEN